MVEKIARVFVQFTVALVALMPLGAKAVCFSLSPDASTLTETYDGSSDRYYYSWESSLAPLSCDFRAAFLPSPTGTLPSGLQWSTKSYPGSCTGVEGGCTARSRELCAFRATTQAEPRSLFLTIDENECAQLKAPGSGWTYLPPSQTVDGVPSLSAFAVEPATGRCSAGLFPVYRFVNQGWPDRGNHRFVADEAVRGQMLARSDWHEEGIAFCALSRERAPISAIEVPRLYPPVVAVNGSECAGGYDAFVACVHTTNMPAFDALLGTGLDATHAAPFASISGMVDSLNWITGYSQGLALHSFVQTLSQNAIAGFHVSSVDRTAGASSSIRTIRRSLDTISALSHTIRQPFLATYDADMELLVTYRLFVKRVRVDAAENNEAYVQPIVTLNDQRSGKRLLLSPGAIGTPTGSGDIVTRDAATGDVLVYLALTSRGASVGRSGGLPTLVVGKNFDSPNAWGYGGDFAWRINRREFPAILAAARNLDPGLSGDPQDYLLEGVGIKAEVVGNAAIGFNLQQMSAMIVRP